MAGVLGRRSACTESELVQLLSAENGRLAATMTAARKVRPFFLIHKILDVVFFFASTNTSFQLSATLRDECLIFFLFFCFYFG
jgi:hypothetical protein